MKWNILNSNVFSLPQFSSVICSVAVFIVKIWVGIFLSHSTVILCTFPVIVTDYSEAAQRENC